MDASIPVNKLQCVKCKNYIKFYKCKAFEKIPDDILSGKHDHKKTFKGDNGILFDPIEPEKLKK